MARTIRRTDDIEEFNDDSLRMQEESERTFVHLEEDEGEALELGDRGRRGFSRLNDKDLFGYGD